MKTLDGPWLIGGDFNANPRDLAESRWPQVIGGTIIAPSAPTCHNSTYDFFVVCNSIAGDVAAVQVMCDSGLNPHAPTRLYLRANDRRKMARRLHRPLKVHGELPYGPMELPPEYDDVHRLIDGGDLDEAMDKWYAGARREWSSLTGARDDARGPKFVWGPAAGNCASPHVGRTTPAVGWRLMAKDADGLR